MNEQEALWFLFKILNKILITKEELTDEEEDTLNWYESYLNFPRRKNPCDDCAEFDCYGCEYAERKEE